MKHVRLLQGSDTLVIAEMKRMRNDVIDEFLKQEIEALEFKIRYSKEETQILQGALRALDDIQDYLKS